MKTAARRNNLVGRKSDAKCFWNFFSCVTTLSPGLVVWRRPAPSAFGVAPFPRPHAALEPRFESVPFFDVLPHTNAELLADNPAPGNIADLLELDGSVGYSLFEGIAEWEMLVDEADPLWKMALRRTPWEVLLPWVGSGRILIILPGRLYRLFNRAHPPNRIFVRTFFVRKTGVWPLPSKDLLFRSTTCAMSYLT